MISAFANPPATQGLAVYFPASIPEVTAVGGTEFADQGGNYWSGPILPRGHRHCPTSQKLRWNDSILLNGLAASGGGFSVVYPQPSWQTDPGFPS